MRGRLYARVYTVHVSQELLERYRHDPAKFISQLVTQDETWIHYFDPESRQQSVQWKHDLEQGKTITGDYYASLLVKLRDAIKDKGRGKLRNGVLLLHDNAPSHSSRVAVASAKQCGFELLLHPSYSPDLAPSDFYLFPKLKENIRGQVFGSDDDVMTAVDTWLHDQDRVFYEHGLKQLEKRWQNDLMFTLIM